jgi:sigma-B regulation protein RsbU (phosphoserine phosphatase)
MNTDGTMFGAERLLKAVSAMAPEDAYSLTQAVFTLVEEFARGAPQADDITVLTLRYTGRRSS